ncbi:MAG: hypothetical protein RLZZ221_2878, partial [Verrucomicrobiota bacterium]
MNLPRTLLTTVLFASLAAALPAADAPATPEGRLAALGGGGGVG